MFGHNIVIEHDMAPSTDKPDTNFYIAFMTLNFYIIITRKIYAMICLQDGLKSYHGHRTYKFVYIFPVVSIANFAMHFIGILFDVVYRS